MLNIRNMILKIEDSSFVELVYRHSWCFFIFYLLVKSINEFPNILRNFNKIDFMSHKSI